MTVEFRLPDVGEGVAEGELVRWLVEPGDPVSEDQPVAEVETDKAVVEVPAPVNGTVGELRAEPGEVVPVGDVIITFETDGEAATGDGEAADGTAMEADPAGETTGSGATGESGGAGAAGDAGTAGEASAADAGNGEGGARVFAPPSVRRLARELGVDLTDVEGTGPSGRITEGDVRAAAERPDTGETAAPSGDAREEVAPADQSASQPDAAVAGAGGGTAPERDRTLATPATRRLAAELDVDLDAVPGEERDGETVVTPEAVREYAEAQRAAQAADAEAVAGSESAGEAAAAGERVAGESADGRPVEREPYRGIRRTIGEAMSTSKFTAPHVTHHDRLDATGLVEAREKLKPRADDRGVKLTYLPLVMKAVVAALKEHPVLNTTLDEDNEEVVYRKYYNLGVAVATDAGLMVPVVEDVDEKGLLQVASEVNELVARARDRSVAREEMQGGTFTVTNFGSVGGEYATPIVNYPETAILGLGALEQRPVVEGGSLTDPGEVVARPVLPLSLSIDHRVIDGAEAAAFANTLKEYLGDPTLLLLE